MTAFACASQGDQKLADLEIGNPARVSWEIAVVKPHDKDVLSGEPLGSFEGCQSNRRTANPLGRALILFFVLRKPGRFCEDRISKRRGQPVMEQATILNR